VQCSQEYDESRVGKNSEALEMSLKEFGKVWAEEEHSAKDSEKTRIIRDIQRHITKNLTHKERWSNSFPLCER
jgi:hypothetical protein